MIQGLRIDKLTSHFILTNIMEAFLKNNLDAKIYIHIHKVEKQLKMKNVIVVYFSAL